MGGNEQESELVSQSSTTKAIQNGTEDDDKTGKWKVCVREIRKREKDHWERIDGACDSYAIRVQKLLYEKAVDVRDGAGRSGRGVMSRGNGSLRGHVWYGGTRGGVDGNRHGREYQLRGRP